MCLQRAWIFFDKGLWDFRVFLWWKWIYMLTSLGPMSSPTVNYPCWIFNLSFSLKLSLVSGMGIEISPSSPFSFFLLGCHSSSTEHLNLWRLTRWEMSHSWAIWPPFLAICPFLFVMWYLLASSDQFTLVSSAYPSTSSFKAFLSHVIASKFPAWRFLLTVGLGSELVSFLFTAACFVSNEESRRSRCLPAYDCHPPRHLKKSNTVFNVQHYV